MPETGNVQDQSTEQASTDRPDADLETLRPPDIRIVRFEDVDVSTWDEFVIRHTFGSPFHLLAWKRTIEESFDYQSMYLMALDGECIKGVVPLFLVQNPIIGKVLISSPFAVYGGILAESDEVLKALHAHTMRLGRELGADHVELRNRHIEQCVSGPNVDRYVSFTQRLVPDEDDLLTSLPKKTRNLVRKAMKPNFDTRSGACDLRVFTDLYARNMRRLGTPVFSDRYFSNLRRNFGSMVDVREVWLEGKPMAASLSFVFRGDVHIYYAAADTRYNDLGPNTYMYFDHLRRAGANGFDTFDFGRSKRGTGAFDFKRHWNTTMFELPYEFVLLRRQKLPNFTPTNPRLQVAIRVWRHVPLWLTRLIGPRLIRLFP